MAGGFTFSVLGQGLCIAVGVAACTSAQPASEAPLFGRQTFHPPPKPGSSISQTRMCQCKMCDPVACCDGPEEDEPPKSCGETYDFTGAGCAGLAVKSCAVRCTQQVWRVRANEDCAVHRPETCCTAG